MNLPTYMTKFNHQLFLWKYVNTGILAGLKRLVKNHSETTNSINKQKYKTS